MLKKLLNMTLAVLVVFGTLGPAPFLSAVANAATPNTISYQGRLRDELGVAVADGDYDFTFTLFDDPAAGASDWTEAQTVTVTDGYFSAQLGSVDPFNDNAGEETDLNASRWLSVVVEGETLAPRVAVNAVAYAMTSRAVESLAAEPAANLSYGGRMYYNTADGQLYVYDAVAPAWVAMSSDMSPTFTGLVTANGGVTADGGVFTVADATGAMHAAGAVDFDSTLDVDGASNFDGALVANSTLDVTGASTLAGLLTANGGVTADGGLFTVADVSGNVHTGGTLDVTGASTLTGLVTATAGVTTAANLTTTGTGDLVSADDLTVADDATVSDALTVAGLASFNGGITVDAGLFTVTDATGAIHSNSSLDIDGSSNFDGAMTVGGASTFNGAATFASASTFTGAVTFSGSPAFSGEIEANGGIGNNNGGQLTINPDTYTAIGAGVPGTASGATDLFVTGDFEVDATSNFDGTSDFDAAANFDGAVTMTSTLGVTGNSTLASLDVGGGYGSTGISVSADGNVQANGTLTVDGISTLTGATTVTGLVTANGGITADAGVFTVADTSGNVHTSGTLAVDGLSTLSGGVSSPAGTGTFLMLTSGGGYGSTGFMADSDGNLSTNGTLLVDGISTLTGATTVTGTLTSNGTLDANGIVTLGDNGETAAIDSLNWDVDADGAMTGIDSIDTIATSATALTFAGAGTVSTGAGSNMSLDTGAADSVLVGTTTAANVVLGSTTTTGLLTLGQSTKTNIVQIANGNTEAAETQTVKVASFNSVVAGITNVNILSGDMVAGTRTLNLGTGTGSKTINIGNDVAATNTIAIGGATAGTALSLMDDNWNVTAGGLANFVSIGAAAAGTGAFTTLSSTGAMTVGTDLSFAKELAHVIKVADSTTGVTAGGALTLRAGQATDGANGGNLSIYSGSLEAGGAVDGDSGNITIDVGTPGVSTGNPGTISIGAAATSTSVAGGYGSTGLTINSAGSVQTNGALTVDGISTLTGLVTANGGIVTSAATALGIDSGTTGAINLGTGVAAKVITIGNGTDDTLSMTGATLNVNADSTTNVTNIGTGNTTGNVNIGTGGFAKTVVIGSTADISGISMYAGLSSFQLTSTKDIALGATDDISINGGSVGSVINLGTSAFAHTVNLAVNALGNTVNVGTDNTIADAINIGSALDTTTIAGTISLNGATTVADGNTFTANGIVILGNEVGDLLAVNPTTLLFTKEAPHTVQIENSTTAATAGGALTVKAAAGLTSGVGGALALAGGAGGALASGGAVSLTGGASGGALGTGGDVVIDSGAKTGGTAGSVLIGTTNGGAITLGKTDQTETITLGRSSNSNTINIGNAELADGQFQTIYIGNGGMAVGATTGGQVVTIGSNELSAGIGLVSGTSGISITTPAGVRANVLCSDTIVGDGAAIVADSIGDCSNGATADYAERYPVAAGIAYGDIVVPGSEIVYQEDESNGRQAITRAVKSSVAYQGPVIGIISNNYGDFTSAGNNISASDNPMPVALVGRVPVNVTNENGPIAVGDFVTTSSTAGKGMKATEAGRVIGMALASFDGTDGQVMVQVVNTWYQPDASEASPIQGGSSSSLSLASGDLTVSGDAQFEGSVHVAEHLVGSSDMAGRASIVAGDTRVHVDFEEAYAYQPIVNATLRSNVNIEGYWFIEEESSTGFDIVLDGTLGSDVEFNWIAVGVDGGEVSVSDGSTRDIELYVLGGSAPASDESEPVVADSSSPSSSSAPEGASEDESVAEVVIVADEEVIEEPVVEETPIVEETPAAEEPVAEPTVE